MEVVKEGISLAFNDCDQDSRCPLKRKNFVRHEEGVRLAWQANDGIFVLFCSTSKGLHSYMDF